MLDINHIIPIVDVHTIFGHTAAWGNFWTETCLTSRTSEGLPQIFFSETGSTNRNPYATLTDSQTRSVPRASNVTTSVPAAAPPSGGGEYPPPP